MILIVGTFVGGAGTVAKWNSQPRHQFVHYRVAIFHSFLSINCVNRNCFAIRIFYFAVVFTVASKCWFSRQLLLLLFSYRYL